MSILKIIKIKWNFRKMHINKNKRVYNVINKYKKLI